MNPALFWSLFGAFFVAALGLIASTSLRFGSDDRPDLRWLKGKRLTPQQIEKLKLMGLSDEDIAKLTK